MRHLSVSYRAAYFKSFRLRLLFVGFAAFICVANSYGAQLDIAGPAGSEAFGTSVTVLPNGNIVVTDPGYDIPAGTANVGAVYLYDGATLALISTLTGSTLNDNVGGGGVTVLTNGNYIIRSHNWDNGAIVDAGAVTFGNGTTGVSGAVSPANSLVGSTANDLVGNSGVVALTNGNYVVRSQNWNNGAIIHAGAVTFGNGTTGVSGAVSPSNSLVGSGANDFVGSTGVLALTNDNYVVRSQSWDNGAIVNAGAVTFGSGTTGISGAVSPANSLVGSTGNDNVGNGGVTALTNGNYVVISQTADGFGAATFGSGTTGVSGTISPANSLVGSTAGDLVGSHGVTALTNGNYVVISPFWDNGAIDGAGAATFGSGTTGVSGAVSPANSLVGSTASDLVGSAGVTALTNGNYVVRSLNWDNGAIADAGAATFGNGITGISGTISPANSLVGSNGITALSNGSYVAGSPVWDNGAIDAAGAATLGSGTTGISGTISPANSLVGSTANDFVTSNGITALTNGNYVVISPLWDNGAIIDAGAVTFGSGTTGISGTISPANSLVGSTANDYVGNGGVTALTNGNYVVISQSWNNGANEGAGAATFGSGTTGVSGTISSANSLVGSTGNDYVGTGGVTALTNGNYVVISPFWHNGAIADAGAITFGSGTAGVSGAVSPANSLVGSTAGDFVGNNGVTALTNGNYVEVCISWDNPVGAVADVGAVSLGNGNGGTVGTITAANSVLGTAPGAGGNMTFAYNYTNQTLVVGRRESNIVTIFLNMISGTVTYGNAAAPPKYISNVTVTGTGSPNVFTTTAAPGGTAGQYSLTGFGSGSYTVSLSKTTGQNSITSNDAARIAQHVSGSLLLTSNNQRVTADASGNGVVSSNDAALIARYVANLGAPIGNTGQWKFYVSPGPTFPVGASPTSRTYSSITSNITGDDYIGLLIGEVTGNWTPSAARPVGSRRLAGGDGPERDVALGLPTLVASVDKEIVVPVNVQGIADKDVISYEFNLRYDPTVIQPLADAVDLKDSVSRGLSFVTNAAEPGILRVVVYGPMPIEGDGVLLNLRFTAVGAVGSVSSLSFERIMFNEGEPRVSVSDGQVELF